MKKYAWCFFLVLVLALVHLFIVTSSVGLKYNAASLKIKYGKLYAESRRLNYFVAKKENLSRIDSMAVSKLGMVYPEKIDYIVIGTKETE
ncbi:MAG: hypothetical protein FD145_1287 [Candidatus Saganbacteria bacterium]|uniref:Cell division protein FtsL n=1 Tax=Candidatus Saganbacteria bacterium TaxID=2575572 RepID=A0A833L0D2_UNCSA|nr:MAG: hypothetical protein FD145_1287 [Candidatus Saganbacteria bacterium]